MRTFLFLSIIALFFFVTPVAAELSTDLADAASAEEVVKYEVTFTVRYNAVTAERAAEIARDIMIEHSSACKVVVKTEKKSNNTGLVFLTGQGDVVWTDY